MNYIKYFARELFMYNFLGIELPYAVLIYSVVFLFPLQLLLCFKVSDKKIKLLPLLSHLFMAVWYVLLDLCGMHWDGVTYLVPAILNLYLAFACGLGFWCFEAIKEKGAVFTSKFITVLLLISGILMIAPKWTLKHTPYEGLVGYAFLYALIYPVLYGISGYLTGKNIKLFWPLFIICTGVFIIGQWVIRDIDGLIYLYFYFGIAAIIMLVKIVKKESCRDLYRISL